MENNENYLDSDVVDEITAEFSEESPLEEDTKNGIFFKISQWCILAIAFLLPVWFLPLTISPVELNKVFMVSFLIVVALICYLFDTIFKGKINIGSHFVFGAMGIAVLLWLASAIFSPNVKMSLWGVSAETSTFFAVILFFILTWLVMMLFGEERALSKLFIALLSGFALLLLMLVIIVTGLGAKLGGVFADRAFNPIGSWNSVALAIGFFIMLLYPFIMWVSGRWRWVLSTLFLISLVLMVVINFTLPWIFIGFFALMLLSYSIWRRNIYRSSILVPILMIVVTIFWFFLNDFVAKSIAIPAPIEVGVSHGTTFEVVKSALKDHLLLGAGPANFGFLWDKFKPVAINTTPFWSVRFTTGSSYLLTILAEVGILGWIFLIVALLGVWYMGLKSLSLASSPLQETISLSSFLLTSYAILMLALYTTGFTLVALSFLAIGFNLASLRMMGRIPVFEFTLFSEGAKGLISAMIVVLLIIVSFGALYVSASKYVGQIEYAKGVNIFNSTGNIDQAEAKISLASKLDGGNDLYSRELSQIYMLRAQAALQEGSTPQNLLVSKFKDSLDSAINSAQSAINVSPMDFINYRNLGKIYESLVPLNTSGAYNAAILQYDAAIKYSPTNPLLFRDEAGVYITQALISKDAALLSKADDALTKATDLKPDYAEAHFLLAQVLDAEGKSSDAIKRGEAAALLAPNDIGSLFQLGLLYYKANRFPDAELVLNRAVSINVDYSNARYFLGLIYDRTNRKQDAITQFQKIAALNPDNSEVQKILSNLNAGKQALSGIVPPAAPPENRQVPPVQESGGGSSLKSKRAQ